MATKKVKLGGLIGAAIPATASIVAIAVGHCLGLDTVYSPGILALNAGLIVNLPGVLVLAVLIPDFFMGAGEDPYEVILLIMATPINCLIYGALGAGIGYLLSKRKKIANKTNEDGKSDIADFGKVK